jgi:hypothetical protein
MARFLTRRFRIFDPIRGALLFAIAWSFGSLSAHQAYAQLGVGGVFIDPDGMLKETSSLSAKDLRDLLAGDAADGVVSADVAARSPLRKISLRRLERTVANLHEKGESPPAECRFLAGLTGIRYVLFYPDSGDVVLAGPAEGWKQMPTGDYVGTNSRRPVLQLDDLIVALRFAFTLHPDGAFLGCSIEPTEQGVRAHADYVRRLGSIDGSRIDEVTQGMEQAIGPQNIHVYGADPSSRFAWQMVAADYRLKRLALAHDPSPVGKVRSYLDIAEKTINGGPQRQHRWWFVGHYDAIRHSADRQAFEFEGPGLKVATAPMLHPGAQAKNGDKSSKPAKQFADLASKHIDELMDKVPAFAELKNLVALAVASAVIRQQSDRDRTESSQASTTSADPSTENATSRTWRPQHFLDDRASPIARLSVPKQTPSLANVRFVKNQFLLFSVSGGVEVDPQRLTDAEHWKPSTGAKLADAQRQSEPPTNSDRWWWD